MVRHRRPPSQDWRTFLENHAKEIVSIDFFTVPTATFRVLFVFLVLSNHRRRIIHFNVTTNPSAAWTGQQIVEAFPWDTAPKYLIRDRDGIYGSDFVRRVGGIGIEDVPISARSPWQSPYVERVIGSIRRECLDHVIVFSEKHLRRVLRSYLKYYHGSRAHLALEKDCPVPRPVERRDGHYQPIHLVSTVAMFRWPTPIKTVHGTPGSPRLSSSARDQGSRWGPSTVLRPAGVYRRHT